MTRVLVLAALTVIPALASAQQMRRAGPGGDSADTTTVGADAKFPYAGVWRGTRKMPMGADQISLRFITDGERYAVVLSNGGGATPKEAVTATRKTLTWEAPNNGGGTWVYRVHLATPDSLVGTLELRDAPDNLKDVGKGTVVLKREPVQRKAGGERR